MRETRVLVVEDDRIVCSGQGMAQAVLGRIFEPFYTTREVGKGTGLGLSIVHGIVAQHGGSIGVKSHPREGARFDVVLPMLERRTEVLGATR